MTAVPKVVVVGAGIAGLGAAWRLARAGVDVTVLEASERPGGRALSLRGDGYTFDVSNPVLSTADRCVHQWIEEVGLRDEMLPLRPVLPATVYHGQIRDVDARTQLGVLKMPGVKWLDALRLVRLPRLMSRYGSAIDPDAPERAADLDDRSLGDFGRLYFGKSLLNRWLAPMVTRTTLGDPDETSRVLFLHTWRHERGAQLGLPRAGLGELPQAAADQLEVRYNVRVARVAEVAGGRVGVTVTDLAAARGPRERVREADAVIVATSAAEARVIADPVLSAAERDALGQIRRLPSVVLSCALRRPFHSHCKLVCVPRDEDSPIDSVLLEPGARGSRVPEGRGLATVRATAAFSAANSHLTNDTLEKDLLAAFERIRHDVRNAIESVRLFRVPDAVTEFGVGHYRVVARLERVFDDHHERGRRVYFAGDYLSGPSLEASLRSGHVAADRLLSG